MKTIIGVNSGVKFEVVALKEKGACMQFKSETVTEGRLNIKKDGVLVFVPVEYIETGSAETVD